MTSMDRAERIKATAAKKAEHYASLVKKYEVRSDIKNKILDMWAMGMTREKIAQDTGKPGGYISTVVCYARRIGDPRAMRRYRKKTA